MVYCGLSVIMTGSSEKPRLSVHEWTRIVAPLSRQRDPGINGSEDIGVGCDCVVSQQTRVTSPTLGQSLRRWPSIEMALVDRFVWATIQSVFCEKNEQNGPLFFLFGPPKQADLCIMIAGICFLYASRRSNYLIQFNLLLNYLFQLCHPQIIYFTWVEP